MNLSRRATFSYLEGLYPGRTISNRFLRVYEIHYVKGVKDMSTAQDRHTICASTHETTQEG